MKFNIKPVARAALIALASFAGAAYALPSLQLTIKGGTYVGGTDETTFAGGNSFVLYALLSPQNNCNTACINALLADTYYISAALAPKVGPGAASLGSFLFDAVTINATSDMTYGTPPLDPVVDQLFDPGDLSRHGIFETFYYQRAFTFSTGVSTTPFNAQTTTPTSSLADNDEGMYFAAFNINIAGLNPNYSVHFDLYNSSVVDCKNKNNCVAGDVDVNDFAPFSHDAQSKYSNGNQPDPPLPEPGVLALLAVGLLGLTMTRRRKA